MKLGEKIDFKQKVDIKLFLIVVVIVLILLVLGTIIFGALALQNLGSLDLGNNLP